MAHRAEHARGGQPKRSRMRTAVVALSIPVALLLAVFVVWMAL